MALGGNAGGTTAGIGTLNEETIVSAVTNIAEDYEAALTKLVGVAQSSKDENGNPRPASMDLSTAIVETTNVQIKQSLLELFTGGVKNLTDHLKSLARKIN